MDTTFWGKPGWNLCHSISFTFNKKNELYYRRFFNNIQHILPCIYCRKSFKKFIKMFPIPDILTKYSLTLWLYTIHNLVNDKLQKQGYNSKPNPSFTDVEKYYNNFVKNIDCLIGLEFLYCIIFNYDPEISENRKKGYIKFFNSLQYILPDKKIQKIYKNYITEFPIEYCMDSCEKMKKWCYKLEATLDKKCCTFQERCKKIEIYRVSNCIENTCRVNS